MRIRDIWKPPEGTYAYLDSGSGEVSALEVKRVLAEGRSEFQSYAILETAPFGRALVLDGQIQSSEYDEWIYHEAIVTPAMCAAPEPKEVAVLGGGEGAVLREVLRHPSVESVVMVDIDSEVVEACRRHLPQYHAGTFEDPRVTVHAADARAWLEDQRHQTFDVIFIDLTEPLAGGPSRTLFTKEFYSIVADHLTPAGVVGLQAGPVRPDLVWAFGRVVRTLETAFASVVPYAAWITSFSEHWGFAVAGGRDQMHSLSPDLVQARLEERKVEQRFLDGEAFAGLRLLPRYVRMAVEQAGEPITDAAPLNLRG